MSGRAVTLLVWGIVAGGLLVGLAYGLTLAASTRSPLEDSFQLRTRPGLGGLCLATTACTGEGRCTLTTAPCSDSALSQRWHYSPEHGLWNPHSGIQAYPGISGLVQTINTPYDTSITMETRGRRMHELPVTFSRSEGKPSPASEGNGEHGAVAYWYQRRVDVHAEAVERVEEDEDAPSGAFITRAHTVEWNPQTRPHSMSTRDVWYKVPMQPLGREGVAEHRFE